MLRKVFNFPRQFIKDWREMQQAMRPMQDPEYITQERELEKFSRLPMHLRKRVLIESFQTWKLTFTDPEEAIRRMEIEAEYVRLAKEKLRQGKWGQETEETADGQIIKRVVTMKDVLVPEENELLWKQAQALFPNKPVNSVDEAVEEAKKRTGEVKSFVSNMLETSRDMIVAFMQAYRDGRDSSREKTIKSEAQITDLESMFRSAKQSIEVELETLSPSTEHTEKRGESVTTDKSAIYGNSQRPTAMGDKN